MALELGPVLKFRGYDAASNQWRLSALVVSKQPPGDLQCGAQRVQPEALRGGPDGMTAYRYLFAASLEDRERALDYDIGGQRYRVAVPARNLAPRMAYGSCNGFSSPKAMNSVKNKDRNKLWQMMAARHGGSPYHLLLLGGDQVYADSMWESTRHMKAWHELGWAVANAAPATPEIQAELRDFYFRLYVARWSQPMVREMLAVIPTIMMWDDHDIIDGWGSYPRERQQCPVFQALKDAAAEAFKTFQQHLAPTEPTSAIAPANGFTFGHVIANTAILAIDMRFERTEKQVLSEAHWNLVYGWLNGIAPEGHGIEHLVLMSSIPVVYPDFDLIERILGFWPGQQELEDDLRDHWNSRPHKGERVRLIHRLLTYAKDKNIRPTILSGDVHVAALGLIESDRDNGGSGESVINQFISSGIVHPAPPGLMLFALRHLFDNSYEIDRGIIARMTEFPGTQHRFIGQRNFLSLEPDPVPKKARIWANWIVEGEEDPFVKVVHPI